jgi:hypothetical protein
MMIRTIRVQFERSAGLEMESPAGITAPEMAARLIVIVSAPGCIYMDISPAIISIGAAAGGRV